MVESTAVSFLNEGQETNPVQVLCGLRGVTASLADMDASDAQDDEFRQRRADLHSAAAILARFLADRIS
ncbi:MAG TPA: hypothetical protein PK163_03145 [Steroidobacteraceae bacterium]|nr:hypothetical protein [Steroidobacteraceae bacterium]